LIEVVRYIHKNPLKAKMVDRLRQFKWSSHNSYIGKTDSLSGLDSDNVLQYFSRKRKTAIELYKRFMGEKEDEAMEKFYSSKKQGSILGDADFVERIQEKYIRDKPDIEIKGEIKIQGEKIIRIIKKQVVRKFEIDEEELYLGKRGNANIARQAALLLSKELSGLKLSEIGLHFGLENYRTVGTHCWRFQEKIKREKGLRKKYIALKSTCS